MGASPTAAAAGGASTGAPRPVLVLVAVSALLVLVGALVLLLVPTSSEQTTTVVQGREVTTTRDRSLLDSEGSWVAILLAVPVALAAIAAFLQRGSAWRPAVIVVAVLLGGLALVSSASIGIFLLPGAGVMVAASIVAMASGRSSDPGRPVADP